ncbi:hypothetical protein [Nonomuraea sp. NPDC049028]
MDILFLLAVVVFAAGAIVAAIQKSWLHVLLFVGLTLVALAQTNLIHS